MKLNKEQERAAHHVQGPMLVLAGPGSGKTHLLVERILYLIDKKGIPPQKILVITFSRKAAEQMQDRFNNRVTGAHYPVVFGTFHSVFYQILSKFYNYSFESILNSKQKREYLAETGKRLNIDKSYSLSWQNDMIEKISTYKTFEEDYLIHDNFRLMDNGDIEEFLKLVNAYGEKCEEEGKIDFEDILIKCRNLLCTNTAALSYCRNKYEYILIDEFQDINKCRYETVKMIAGDDSNLFCVGDDDQSIYAFRGARPDILQSFLADYGNCEIVNLTTNYRCAKQIIDAADRLIRHNAERIDRPIQNAIDNKDGIVELLNCDNSKDESIAICDKISYLISERGYMRKDIAVIYRSAHAVSVLEEMLSKRQIPFYSSEKRVIFYKIPEVTMIISYLKIAKGRADLSDFLNVLNHPDRNLSREALSGINDSAMPKNLVNNNYPGRQFIESLYDYYCDDADKRIVINKLRSDIWLLSGMSSPAAVNYILYGINLSDDILKKKQKAKETVSDPAALLESIKSRAKEFPITDDWLDFINDCTQEEQTQEDLEKMNSELDCINLLSAHSSKGLEYKVVFIAGLTEGIFPHVKSLDAGEIEEERRLMYVALTRAKECLYLCARGNSHKKAVSRFVGEIFDDYCI